MFIWKDASTPIYVHYNAEYNSPVIEITQVANDRQEKKLCYMYTMHYNTDIIDGVLEFHATWANWGIMLSEISWREKNVLSIKWGESLMSKQRLLKQREKSMRR